MENLQQLLSEIKIANEQLVLQETQIKLCKETMQATLILLLAEVNTIINKIALCQNIQEAERYFYLLEEVQSIVAILISQGKITISHEFWKLYKDFDRIDLVQEREYLFNQIKHNKYSLK